MSTFSGNNLTFTGANIVNSNGNIIIRSGLTSNSTDTLPTAADLVTNFTGQNSSTNNGQSFTFSIINNSTTYTITLNNNTGLTYNTGVSADTIVPGQVKTYTAIQTAVSTCVLYTLEDGSIPLGPGNIAIGNSVGVATGVIMSGDATITNAGVLSLSTLTNVLNSSNTTASTSNATGAITLVGGLGINNTTNATSSTNGGTITTAGGVAIAKDLFVGGSATTTISPGATTTNIGCSTTTGATSVNVAYSLDSTIQSSVMSSLTAGTIDSTKTWTSVCYGSGTFVAVSNSAGATAGLVRTSTDGITWTSRTAASINTWSAVCFAPDINTFCAVSSNGTANTSAMYSTNNGATWTQTGTLALGTYSCVCRGTNVSGTLGNIFVTANSSGNNSGNQIYTSPDAITWTSRTVPTTSNYSFVCGCWSSALSLFVFIGTIAPGGSQIITSPDGVTWTNRTSPSTQKWSSVCWSPELGLFVAVAIDGTVGQQIMYSSNGTTWLNATSPSAQQWQSVCWSSNYKMFVAVANNGTASQQIMYSSTGSGTWTAATATSASAWSSITFSDNVLDKFVAVAATAATGNSMYSVIPSGLSTNLTLGSTGQTNIAFNASNLVVYPVPYYYGENTVLRTVVANTPLTDITIYNVPNGRYLVQIWMLTLLKTGNASTDFIIMTGSNQGTIYSFTATPALSLVGSASALGASTGPKFFQFAINSYSSTGIQNVSYQYQSTAGSNIFTAGTLRTMVLQRIG